jgi:hypothetical protein
VLADRLRQYAALCGDGSMEVREQARTYVEQLLPTGDWLAPLLAPANGQVLGADQVEALFPAR